MNSGAPTTNNKVLLLGLLASLLLHLAALMWPNWQQPAKLNVAGQVNKSIAIERIRRSQPKPAAPIPAKPPPKPEPPKKAVTKPKKVKPKQLTPKKVKPTLKPRQTVPQVANEPTPVEPQASVQNTAKIPPSPQEDGVPIIDRVRFAKPPLPPIYPRLAIKRRQSGLVMVRVLLGPSGAIEK